MHSLIASYNLFSKCKLCPGREATDEELQSFHSSSYLECLKKAEKSSDLEKLTDSQDAVDFNLGYDCPLFENIYEFVKVIAGSTLAAAEKLISEDQLTSIENKITEKVNVDLAEPKSYLKYKMKPVLKKAKKEDLFDIPANLTLEESDFNNSLALDDHLQQSPDTNENDLPEKNNVKDARTETGKTDDRHLVAVNWLGGWHHAQRDEAEGFCYVNDIVIAIQYLLKAFKRVLYLDLDVHHGNGVENAFSFSPRVFTFSMHKYETGFYPASGSLNDIGQGNGKYYAVNIPLKDGITDEKYVNVFKKVMSKIVQKYQPQCIVVQCGADSIAGDPLGGFNLTPVALGRCLKLLLGLELPTLVLGGGGYNIPNAARCWTFLTSVILDSQISEDIPDNHVSS